jgi:DNA-binding transcriptional regulator GbsR (MarR family)
MNDKKVYEKTENILIEECGNYFEYLGAKPLLGRIFGYLVSKSEPVSLKEIAVKLQISKPSASNNLRYGVHSEMFKKVYNSDVPREDFYMLGIDFMEMMIDPGIKKLSLLGEKFNEAKKFLDENYEKIKDDEKSMLLYKRLSYLVKAFKVLLEEYHVFGEKIQERLKELKKEY